MKFRIICTVAFSTLIMMMSACSRCEAEKTILEIDSEVERESLRIVLNGSELPLVPLEGCFQKPDEDKGIDECYLPNNCEDQSTLVTCIIGAESLPTTVTITSSANTELETTIQIEAREELKNAACDEFIYLPVAEPIEGS